MTDYDTDKQGRGIPPLLIKPCDKVTKLKKQKSNPAVVGDFCAVFNLKLSVGDFEGDLKLDLV